MSDVRVRWQSLHETWPALRLYALVDGVQYQSHFCKRLRPGPGLFALFDGTPDAALAHAGPWLVIPASWLTAWSVTSSGSSTMGRR
ncbi:DUF4123 domain-containing protein [Rubrivivax gelatinosus]|uniref:DUF4123 domain-containing protein n=1 Tax=Rubrivivax gelatinosus TaxID=28068 RepID=UPI001E488C56|nr:DUF4123 domain-containing protein [Rubrivivax gelatinosus]